MKKLLDESIYQKKWIKENTYKYISIDKNKIFDRSKTFVIDTPPPTVSGSLHIGHIFSYTQTDILARFNRMKGKNIFYPMGWDNNGLPTERRVQNLYKVFCDPYLLSEVEPVFEDIINRKQKKKLSPVAITRKSFLKLCAIQSQEDQEKYKNLWCQVGLSVDWEQSYETISPSTQIISQRSFVDLYQKGLVENQHRPVFWDTQFKTAIAQADIEERKREGFYYNIPFKIYQGGGEFIISTTRPELLPACIAIAAHPEDERYKKFFHKQAVSPLFTSVVPVIPSIHADPTKGTGILMICTFGDREDVQFWQKHNLPLKQVITSDGFFKDITFESFTGSKNKNTNHFLSLQVEQANSYYQQLKGLRVLQVRKEIIKILTQTKNLILPSQPTEQSIKFYEKGDYPLELIPTRQWYIKILKYKKELLQQGRRVKWNPLFMLKRYEQWVEGINQDWCISRQRFVGVPFPVWYSLDKNKIPDYNNPLLPYDSFFSQNKKDIVTSIPVDPLSSAPAAWDTKWKHYTEDKRGEPEGFIADSAVMDTWATSSLTPQINAHWGGRDVKRYSTLFPADLRPQAHEIIRTWAFYTIAKSFFHGNSFNHNTCQSIDLKQNVNPNIPWEHIAISGWVMNPQRLKVSKSKGGNIVSPAGLLEEYSADAIRYWAGKSRLGVDTIYDENMFKTGRKLIVKLNNAFKFVQIFTQYQTQNQNSQNNTDLFIGFKKSISYVESTVDQAWLIYLLDTYQTVTLLLEKFCYSQALDLIEKSFWVFCDNYLELVKGRAYQITHIESKTSPIKESLSAIYSLDLSIYIMTKLLAPYLPYITEHIWSQRYSQATEEPSSVHISLWNSAEPHLVNLKKNKILLCDSSHLLDFTFNVLKQIRNLKSDQNKSLSTAVKELKIISIKQNKVMFNLCREDIEKAAFVKSENTIFVEDSKKEVVEVQLLLES